MLKKKVCKRTVKKSSVRVKKGGWGNKRNDALSSQRRNKATYYKLGYSNPHIGKHKHMWRVDYRQGRDKYMKCAVCGSTKVIKE